MLGRDIINYIKENNLEDKEVLTNGTFLGYIPVPEAAKKLGVEEITIRQWIRRKKIPMAIRIGNCWLVPNDMEYPKAMIRGKNKTV